MISDIVYGFPCGNEMNGHSLLSQWILFVSRLTIFMYNKAASLNYMVSWESVLHLDVSLAISGTFTLLF